MRGMSTGLASSMLKPGCVQVDGAMDAGNILKPALARGTLHCIGATTFAEFERHIAIDAALARRFQPVLVDEPTPAAARNILEGLRPRYEAFHGVRYAAAALDAAVAGAAQNIADRKLPDAAIDLMDEAAALRHMLPGAPVATAAPAVAALPPPPPPAAAAARAAARATPRACPHCGLVAPPATTTALRCAECGTHFLNISQHQLALGTSVLPPERRRPGWNGAAVAAGGGATAAAAAGGAATARGACAAAAAPAAALSRRGAAAAGGLKLSGGVNGVNVSGGSERPELVVEREHVLQVRSPR